MNTKNILLIGLGPHAKRIYIRGLRKLGLFPILVIDLLTQKHCVEAYLHEHRIPACTHFIPAEEKDRETLSSQLSKDLDRLVKAHQITHAIISTEPKAHYAYLQYLIPKGISVLTDKPITCPIDVCNRKENAILIKKQFQHLSELAFKHKTPVTVQCQRRYDKRYQYITTLVSDLIKKYELPVHIMQIHHSDGSFYTPEEILERENHPYKYGYGKLFHSGYHFIDLASMMLCLKDLPDYKTPDCLQLQSSHYSPSDQLFCMDEPFYQKIFQKKSYRKEFESLSKGTFQECGELDFTAALQFTRNQKIVTTCSLNLLSSGFSRRGWEIPSTDTYKNNGRVRHESMNLTIGPLLNIQVHSYQSCEVKERNNPFYDHNEVGGLDHYQIHIFRNTAIIGGKPVEIIEGKDLFANAIAKDPAFIGYNEAARDECLEHFLKGTDCRSRLIDHKLTIDILTASYLSIVKKRQGKFPFVKMPLS